MRASAIRLSELGRMAGSYGCQSNPPACRLPGRSTSEIAAACGEFVQNP
jgi:hypothetical protein